MGRTRKPATAAPETAQEAQEQQNVSQDTQGQETAAEAAQRAAETVQEGAVTQEIAGPDDPADLLGCEDADYVPTAEGLYVEYAVNAKGGLRLREEPSMDAPIIAVLPRGAGVLACEEPENGWLHVRTGRLKGWMMSKFLEAIPWPAWPPLDGEKLPYGFE